MAAHACVHEIGRILIANAMALRRYAEEINGTEKNFEGENYFILGDQKIIDWDITRWYLEEDRKKHPEYYRNSVQVQLTENYVRGIFDEICEVIEQDNIGTPKNGDIYSDIIVTCHYKYDRMSS